ncbi:hypothetical protein PW5551_03275 [Petrotoga sp. 9PW.55.5.1]|uniref:hypothetical protein n=1 Tax=Petrotoga sp. 9PW.55.5.1 TaxID=1308979 RepID=UPI000DC3D455|nr:hypothetical protein [Petrotoga sp. 9PW.55.5.1]RAO99521.1 hypothetical protein PW5551_03275 [Petrotoga sp. 9PW.55.5.1]
MIRILEIVVLFSLCLTLIKLILSKSKWEKLLSYSSFSSKSVLLMLIFSFNSHQLFLLDVIIIFLVLNIWGILIVSTFLQRGGSKR